MSNLYLPEYKLTLHKQYLSRIIIWNDIFRDISYPFLVAMMHNGVSSHAITFPILTQVSAGL
jgi:hypothetical protein